MTWSERYRPHIAVALDRCEATHQLHLDEAVRRCLRAFGRPPQRKAGWPYRAWRNEAERMTAARRKLRRIPHRPGSIYAPERRTPEAEPDPAQASLFR